MLTLKQSALMVVATLWLSTAVLAAPTNDATDDSDDDGNDIQLPANVTQLFADVYANNSVSLYLKSRAVNYATRKITEIAPNVFMAINYALGNTVWIVTPQNTIIVLNAPEGVEIATLVRTDMRKIPAIGNKPITFLIYTLFQGDHIFGAAAFVNDPANGGKIPTIIAHKNLVPQAELFDMFKNMKMKRVLRVFGNLLPPSVAINAFPALVLGRVQYTQYWPSVLLDLANAGDWQEMTIDGVTTRFIYTPGYSADEIVVWLPETKVLSCSDLFYSAYPNIYTIRGEPARDALAWAKSVRIMRSYYPEVLSPAHSDPVFGREYIADILEKRADATQFVHDQTVRLTAKALTPDAVSRLIKLPDSLQNDPTLVEVYGAIEGHSRAVADQYTGWFNGEGEDLYPPTKDEASANMVRDLGRERLLQLARRAYNNGEYRWALTLATYVWRAENKPKNDALYWRTQALKRLAENTEPVQWRNYLFSTALIDWGMVNPQLAPATIINSKPLYLTLHTISNCFQLLAGHVDPAKVDGLRFTIDLQLTDDPDLPAGQVYRLTIRNSIFEFEKVTPEVNSPLNPLFQSTNAVWRQVLAHQITLDQALSTNGIVVVRGSNINIQQFFGCFDFVDEV